MPIAESEREAVTEGLVRHLAERLADDGLLHESSWSRRLTCDLCELVKSLPIAEQLRLAALAGDRCLAA